MFTKRKIKKVLKKYEKFKNSKEYKEFRKKESKLNFEFAKQSFECKFYKTRKCKHKKGVGRCNIDECPIGTDILWSIVERHHRKWKKI